MSDDARNIRFSSIRIGYREMREKLGELRSGEKYKYARGYFVHNGKHKLRVSIKNSISFHLYRVEEGNVGRDTLRREMHK